MPDGSAVWLCFHYILVTLHTSKPLMFARIGLGFSGCTCQKRWNFDARILAFITDAIESRYKRKLNELLTFNNYSSVCLKRELSSKAFVVWLLIHASFSLRVVFNFGESSEFHVYECILRPLCLSLKLLFETSRRECYDVKHSILCIIISCA